MYQSHKTPLCFRPLADSDLPMLHSLLATPDIAAQLHWSPTFQELTDAYWRFWKDDPDEQHFLLTMDGQRAGWLKLNGFCGESLWVSMLVVAPDFQGKHLGYAALGFAETQARQHGFQRLGIQTTADNLSAVALYLKNGYRLVHYIQSEQRYILEKALS